MRKKTNHAIKGVVLITLSALCFGLLPIFALYAYRSGITVTTLLLIRFTGAGLLMFLYLSLRPPLPRPGIRSLLVLLILGVLLQNVQSQFYLSSVRYIPASLAALFLYVFPILVTLLSAMVNKEHITKKTTLSISISFLGLILILGTSFKSLNGLGVRFALGAAVIYAVYIVLGNRVGKTVHPIQIAAYISIGSAMGVLLTGLTLGGLDFGFSKEAWLPLTGMILISTIGSMTLFFKGMELLGPTRSAIISMTEPVFTVIFSSILFMEHLTLMQSTGGALVLAGSLLVTTSRQEPTGASAHGLNTHIPTNLNPRQLT